MSTRKPSSVSCRSATSSATSSERRNAPAKPSNSSARSRTPFRVAKAQMALRERERRGLRVRQPRHGRQDGGAGCQLEKLSAGKFHDAPSMNFFRNANSATDPESITDFRCCEKRPAVADPVTQRCPTTPATPRSVPPRLAPASLPGSRVACRLGSHTRRMASATRRPRSVCKCQASKINYSLFFTTGAPKTHHRQ
jgi:hypothetical protein